MKKLSPKILSPDYAGFTVPMSNDGETDYEEEKSVFSFNEITPQKPIKVRKVKNIS